MLYLTAWGLIKRPPSRAYNYSVKRRRPSSREHSVPFLVMMMQL